MAIGEVLITTIGSLCGVCIATFGGYWIAILTGRAKVTKDSLKRHSVFATMHSWRVEQINALTVNQTDKTKDHIIHAYAKAVLSVYINEINQFVNNVNKDEPKILIEFYLNMVQLAHEELEKQGIPSVFSERVFDYSSALRESTSAEVTKLDQSNKKYYVKVYEMLNHFSFFINTLFKGLPQIALRLNGEFDQALEEWKQKHPELQGKTSARG